MATESFDWLSKFKAVADDSVVQGYIAQLRAKALLQELTGNTETIRWTYDPRRLVRNFTAATFALEGIALQSQDLLTSVSSSSRRLALAWEALGNLSEGSRLGTSFLNAAVEYELAGYTANATCLARRYGTSIAGSPSPDVPGLSSLFLQRLFVMLREQCAPFLKEPNPNELEPGKLTESLAKALLCKALVDSIQYFHRGDSESFDLGSVGLANAEFVFSRLGLIQEANLARRLRVLIPVIRRRSTWSVLGNSLPDSPRWTRYLKLLARGTRQNIRASPSVSELWPSQLAAVAGGLLGSNISKICRMPTSAGKTRIAELAIVHSLLTSPSSKCVYIAPFRALVTELEEVLLPMFADVGFRVSAILGSYESDDFEELIASDTDILVTTPEKLDLLFRTNAGFFDRVRLFVLDEGQLVHDGNRGPKFELLLSRLRRRVPEARFLFVSAVIPQETLEDFAHWLGGKSPAGVIVSDWRPSIQRVARFEWSGESGRGTIRYEPSEDMPRREQFVTGLIEPTKFVVPLEGSDRKRVVEFPSRSDKGQVAAELAIKFSELGPVLIFCSQRNYTAQVAEALLTRIGLTHASGAPLPPPLLGLEATKSLEAVKTWLGKDHVLAKVLSFGIGIHHGHLPAPVREAIESDFRERKLSILAATNTLAQGVNLPIRTVVIHSSRRYDPGRKSRVRISSADYWNIVGRAGRAGEETEGTVVHITLTSEDRVDYRVYLRERKRPPPMRSALYDILTGLVSKRISPASLHQRLDPEILALLAEEAPGITSVVEGEDILKGTLTAEQGRRYNLNVAPLRNFLRNRAEEIGRDVPSNLRALFSATGLTPSSCKSILEHVRAHEIRLREWLADPNADVPLQLSGHIFDGISTLPEMQTGRRPRGDIGAMLNAWMGGATVPDLMTRFNVQELTIEDLGQFVEDFFAYRLPWGFSAYLNIAYESLSVNSDSVSPRVRYLPAMIKFGVRDPVAVWALSSAMPTRESANALARAFSRLGIEQTPQAFRSWLGRVDLREVTDGMEIGPNYKRDVVKAVVQSGTNELLQRFTGAADALPRVTEVKGTFYTESLRVARAVSKGTELDLVREYDNPFDRNAIQVRLNGISIGYIERPLAQVLAPDMDTGIRVRAVAVSVETTDVPRIALLLTVPGPISVGRGT